MARRSLPPGAETHAALEVAIACFLTMDRICWRRRESNPRPREPAVKRTTCVSGSVIVGRRIRTGKKTAA